MFISGLTFAIWVLESLFEYLYLIEWRGLAQNLEHDLRIKAYDHAQRLDLSWHEKQTIGNITSILNDDVLDAMIASLFATSSIFLNTFFFKSKFSNPAPRLF